MKKLLVTHGMLILYISISPLPPLSSTLGHNSRSRVFFLLSSFYHDICKFDSAKRERRPHLHTPVDHTCRFYSGRPYQPNLPSQNPENTRRLDRRKDSQKKLFAFFGDRCRSEGLCTTAIEHSFERFCSPIATFTWDTLLPTDVLSWKGFQPTEIALFW